MSKMEGTLHEHDTGYAEWLNSEAPKAGGNVVKYEWFDNNIPIPDGETAYEPVGFGIEPDDTWAWMNEGEVTIQVVRERAQLIVNALNAYQQPAPPDALEAFVKSLVEDGIGDWTELSAAGIITADEGVRLYEIDKQVRTRAQNALAITSDALDEQYSAEDLIAAHYGCRPADAPKLGQTTISYHGCGEHEEWKRSCDECWETLKENSDGLLDLAADEQNALADARTTDTES